jgi:hypothetical protein
MCFMAAKGPACRMEREPDACGIVARANAIVARQDQLEPATDAYAMHGRDDGHGHSLDPVEHRVDGADRLGHLRLGFQLFEFADVGPDDEALLLAAHQHQACDAAGAGFLLDVVDDRHQLFERAAA